VCNHPIVSIIDDDESVRIATSSLVRSLGWNVRLYESAEHFLQCGPVCDLTCIISDVRMPGLSGVEMYRELCGRGARPPIIFISAFASEKVRRQAFDAGAACVLSKPVDAADVMRCLESVRTRADGVSSGRPPAASR